MTQSTHQTPTVTDERSAVTRLFDNPLALIAATLAAAPLGYAAYLMISDGWLGVAKAWLAWPTFTALNIGATVATFVSARLAKREFEQTVGRWRIQSAAVFIVSAALCIAFILSALIILAIVVLHALNDSDDDSDSDFRPRRGRHRRRRPQHRIRSRSRRGRSRSRTRRRRSW